MSSKMQSNIGFVKFSYFCIFPNVTPTLLLSYFVNVLLLYARLRHRTYGKIFIIRGFQQNYCNFRKFYYYLNNFWFLHFNTKERKEEWATTCQGQGTEVKIMECWCVVCFNKAKGEQLTEWHFIIIYMPVNNIVIKIFYSEFTISACSVLFATEF